MRKALLTLCFVLMCAVSTFAQSKSNSDAMRDSVLYVIDGVKQRGLKQLDTATILEISVYKDSAEPKKKYGNDARNGVIEITTKQFAVKAYQKKLSEFSKQYKAYIEDKNKSKIYGISTTYYINGKPFPENSKESITKLYSLWKDNFTSLLIDTRFDASYSPVKYYKIYITTKK